MKFVNLTEQRYYNDDTDINGIETILNTLIWCLVIVFCLILF